MVPVAASPKAWEAARYFLPPGCLLRWGGAVGLMHVFSLGFFFLG